MGRKQTYSVEGKLRAVELYLSGEMGGYRRVAEKFNVDPSQIVRWVRAYKQEGIDGLKEERGLVGRKPKNPSDQEKIKRLEAEVAYLKNILRLVV
ncbi:helix-turn-helix domain-containing protein [Domibacillus sp. A3M-37]|uniref:helix-turn-helix domain-containing protein n=1 Tax=Domibacillus sp. A3M-37 TaxID=2962037 RepID=UPI0020B70C5D|nr:helix-turn-helix domain-containing protein [Domibacillus sp. A3M-37]MCP3764737.1 helix-turn-helix domain-containing protein [Domibacillus sp. A3M-37]